MAAARGQQLLRTDDKVSGVVRFYDRREEDAKLAFIGEVNIRAMLDEAGVDALNDHPMLKAVLRAAVHGVTQNILDSSNKLDGDARVEYVRKMCEHCQSGGWASAPVDEDAAAKRLSDMLAKLPADVRAKFLADAAKNQG